MKDAANQAKDAAKDVADNLEKAANTYNEEVTKDQNIIDAYVEEKKNVAADAENKITVANKVMRLPFTTNIPNLLLIFPLYFKFTGGHLP